MKILTRSSLLILLIITFGCQTESDSPAVDFSALSEEQQHAAENALAGMTLAEGLSATLFASEPTLINPTNINVDERGRVWVIEALNYRNRLNPNNPYRKEGDRILILEDTNGDGKSDKTSVFYQGEDINSALGIWVMGNKVIVSSSPNIWLFTDENGDDQPDDKRLLFTKLEGYDHDHGVHAFVFGPDGRLYFNMGNEGVQLFTADERPVIDMHGRQVISQGKPYRQGLALRCEVDGSQVEVLGHNFRNNYELAVDSYGSIWQSDNDDDGNKATRINFVMEYGNYGFTDELTGAGWRTRRVGMHQDIPKRHWHQNDPGVVPNLLQTGSGSPCGIVFYEGDLLPAVFRQQMIHCEPGHQVVRAYPVKKSGAGYTAEIVNIMKSADQWFRPSDVCVAPDGSLLVADWYDPGVGGHRMGDIERGRIYRIAPKKSKYKMPKVDTNTPETAVQALGNPNLSLRYLAWTRLHQWGAEAEEALRTLWQGEQPHLRARALWLLARIPGQTQNYIEQAVKDENPDIRITGLRAARQLDPENLIHYLEQVKEDASAGVRREAAIALRFQPPSTAAAELWATLANQYDGSDRWYLEALGIGADLNAEQYFGRWMEKNENNWNNPAGRDIVWRMRSAASLPLLTKMITDPDVSESDLKRFFRAFHFQKTQDKNKELAGMLDLDHPLKKEISAYALGQMEADYVKSQPGIRKKISKILPEIKGSPEWLSAVKSLQLKDQQRDLLQMFLQQEDESLAVEAGQLLLELGGTGLISRSLAAAAEKETKLIIQRLGWLRSGDEAPALLMQLLKDKEMALPQKRLVVESLGNSWNGQHELFAYLEGGHLEPELVNTAAMKLMYCWNPDIRNAAPKYLKDTGNEAILPSLEELAERKGNVAIGKSVFQSHCANCHQVSGEGINFGPDLTEIGSKLARTALYTAIIYPSAGINFGYEGYLVKLKDNTLYSGYIESDTEDQLTLRMMGGISQMIKKSDIQSIEEMHQSLMIPGLHKLLKEEELVDLVEYLSSLRSAELLSTN